MQTNILEYLENSVERFPEKTAFADEKISLSFMDFSLLAKSVGTVLYKKGARREPVIVYMEKSPFLLAAFFGVVYGGCFYVPIDSEMPRRRMELILANTDARYLICDGETAEDAKKLCGSGITLLCFDGCRDAGVDGELLSGIRERAIDTDPVSIFYTSGSTGVPKGVVAHHRGIIDYIDSLSEVLCYDEDSVFANQTPLYWDASMKEIYATLKHGATTYLLPKEYFMFPIKIVEFLNKYKINSINWVVSALTMISAFGTFDMVKPKYLRLVTFCGEVFPVKQFNIWKNALPGAEFYNLYGPTEATGVSTYYHADRIFSEDEAIPIGKPFKNTQILLLDGQGSEVPYGMSGEICIRGTCVAHGYYNDTERTEEAFTQNPTNPYYRDLIYRTGDLAKRDREGNLVFVSRKDYQIKHMGHRIELGEIEADVSAVDGVKSCSCIFVKEKNKIVLFYTGDIDKKNLTKALKERLPRYMLPNAIMQLDALPLTATGKMDRKKMAEIYLGK